MDQLILTRPFNLPPLLVCWATRNFHLFHTLHLFMKTSIQSFCGVFTMCYHRCFRQWFDAKSELNTWSTDTSFIISADILICGKKNRTTWNQCHHFILSLTHWPRGDMAVILKVLFSNSLWRTAWVGTCFETAHKWLLLKLTNDKSTLTQVMAWCRQATSHYLNQCWPRSMTPYSIMRTQWVKCLRQFHLMWYMV